MAFDDLCAVAMTLAAGEVERAGTSAGKAVEKAGTSAAGALAQTATLVVRTNRYCSNFCSPRGRQGSMDRAAEAAPVALDASDAPDTSTSAH